VIEVTGFEDCRDEEGVTLAAYPEVNGKGVVTKVDAFRLNGDSI